jgi:23S rRNA pseudouridine2605 synthase
MTDQTRPSSPYTERLQRVLAARGVASRRKAEELIRAGRVTVNGKVVTELGTKVDPQRAAIRVDGKPVRKKQLRYVVMNKPSGFITTTSDERGRHTVMDLLPSGIGLNPVGRLDRDTEGLLLFTNDGEVANRVMHPRYGLTKEYVVQTPMRPPESAMRMVRAGIEVEGKLVVPHECRIMRETANGILLSVVVHEGMNRVVRRLMDAAEIPVIKLSRSRIGPLSIAGIPRGAHRDLTEGELTSLLQALHLEREDEALVSPGANSRPSPKPASSRPQRKPPGNESGSTRHHLGRRQP